MGVLTTANINVIADMRIFLFLDFMIFFYCLSKSLKMCVVYFNCKINILRKKSLNSFNWFRLLSCRKLLLVYVAIQIYKLNRNAGIHLHKSRICKYTGHACKYKLAMTINYTTNDYGKIHRPKVKCYEMKTKICVPCKYNTQHNWE